MEHPLLCCGRPICWANRSGRAEKRPQNHSRWCLALGLGLHGRPGDLLCDAGRLEVRGIRGGLLPPVRSGGRDHLQVAVPELRGAADVEGHLPLAPLDVWEVLLGDARHAVLRLQAREPHARALHEPQVRRRVVGLLVHGLDHSAEPRPAAKRTGLDRHLLLGRLLLLSLLALRPEESQSRHGLRDDACALPGAPAAAGLPAHDARRRRQHLGDDVECGGGPLGRVHAAGDQVQHLAAVLHVHEDLGGGVQEVLRRERLPSHTDGAHRAPHQRHRVDLGALVVGELVQGHVRGDVVALAHVGHQRAQRGELDALLRLDADVLHALLRSLRRHREADHLGPDEGICFDGAALGLRDLGVPRRRCSEVSAGRGVRVGERLCVLLQGGRHQASVSLELR
mmetsp:Transcript_52487/g.162966  ORF Transcript_52487/g.162966 Transcript_52487/m.162966 type:complete len:396 (+) Transcript_52487:36-1223(+)